MKVRCIDDTGNRHLTKGTVYTVADRSAEFSSGVSAYTLVGKMGQHFNTNRFITIEDDEDVIDAPFEEAPTATLPRINPAAAPTVDTSDWRVWRDHNRPANNCACGIPRAQCTYHKEIEHDSGY